MPRTFDAVDLFAGPGGWTAGARILRLITLGLEWDADACATRAAAGYATIRADVAAYPTERAARTPGLIASAPCTMFSKSGTRSGVDAATLLAPGIVDLFAGRDTRAAIREAVAVELVPAAAAALDAKGVTLTVDAITAEAQRRASMAALILEPARWAAARRPRWVALEQVPPVLPLFEVIAEQLRGRGYSAWCGELNAADYGVAQARRRAILIASLDDVAHPPPATHAAGGPDPHLFGAGLPASPTMAAALDWHVDPEPLEQFTTPRGPVVGSVPDDVAEDGLDATGWAWEPTRSATIVPADRWLRGPASDPDWPAHRPALTVLGDYRIPQPGHKATAADVNSPGRLQGAIRCTRAELAALQSFAPWHPFRGGSGSVALQVGNAVPPLFAAHVLAAAAGLERHTIPTVTVAGPPVRPHP